MGARGGCNGVQWGARSLRAADKYLLSIIVYTTVYVWRVGGQQPLLMRPCMVELGCNRVLADICKPLNCVTGA